MLAKDILIKSRLLLLFTILLFTACAPQAAATTVLTAARMITAAWQRHVLTAGEFEIALENSKKSHWQGG